MKAIGLAVEVRDRRPVVSVVAINDSSGVATLEGWFELTSADEDLATQLHTLSKAAVTRIGNLLPADRAVVRRADTQPRGVGATEPVKLRLIAEGAVIAAVRDRLVDVLVVSGVELGRLFGSSKSDLDAAALAIVEAANVSPRVGERKRIGQAASAALAGLSS